MVPFDLGGPDGRVFQLVLVGVYGSHRLTLFGSGPLGTGEGYA